MNSCLLLGKLVRHKLRRLRVLHVCLTQVNIKLVVLKLCYGLYNAHDSGTMAWKETRVEHASELISQTSWQHQRAQNDLSWYMESPVAVDEVHDINSIGWNMH